MPIPNLDMSINNDKDIKDLVGYDGICTQQYDMGLSQTGWPEKTAGYGPMAHRLWDFGGSCGCSFSDSTT